MGDPSEHQGRLDGATADASFRDVAPPALDRGGMKLGPFLLLEKCGQGAMGVVYAARDLRDGLPVAVKVLPAGLLADLGRARRFAAEAKVLASLRHVAIVRHIEHGTTPHGELFLAMEWLEGEDLSRTLERRELSVREVVSLGQRIAEGLAAAHARGVVHRDIKPSNLFLRGGVAEQVVILDFGIARDEQALFSLTATGMVIGTPGYMAPEQARGAPEIDARADLFSLGAVLFECLAGRPAFAGQHVMAVLAKVLLEDPPRLVALRPSVPPALDALVARLLAKDPAARPPSAAAVAAELARMSLDSGDLETAPARSRAGMASSITDSEQRFLCVILAGAARAAPETIETSPAQASAATRPVPSPEGLLVTLEAVAAPLGAKVLRLLDGSVIATLQHRGNAADQAAQAARCALALHALLPEVPIAIATGLGDASTPVPVGQVLDRAAGLVRASGRDADAGAWIDEVTAGLLDVRFVVREGPRGRELVEERCAGEGARLLLGRPSPCVGREWELRSLGELLDECVAEGVASAVLVKAPAGGGKSRLLHEFLALVSRRDDGVAVWFGRGDPISAGSAFAMIASALLRAAEAHEGEALSVRRQKLAARVARHVAEKDRARVADFLGELIGAPFADSESPLLRGARGNPAIMAEQIRRAFEDFVEAECAAGPVLLALEDLHWGDVPSVKLLDGVLDRLRDRPLLVVAVGRPEVDDLFPKLWAERGLQEIRLGGLTRRAAERLVRHALGEAISADTVARIVERAAGNAFYLEELIRAVAEGRGAALPETVLAMVQARLDALDVEDRRILRAASVFGEAFWEGGILGLLGGAERIQDAEERLASLVARELILRRDESRFPGETELAFRHALLRDGAYTMLVEQDRALGHRLAGAWLEERGESDPRVLAEHFERGGELARAAVHHTRAAQQAVLGNDLREAMARGERALACGIEGELRFELLVPLARARWFLGDFAGAEAMEKEVLQCARKGSRAFCSMLSNKMTFAQQRSYRQELSEVSAMIRDIVPEADNSGPLAQLYWALLALMPDMGDDLVEHFKAGAAQIVRLLSPLDRMGQGFASAINGALAVYFDGDLGQGTRLYLNAAVHVEAAGDLVGGAIMRATAGSIYGLLGAYERSEEEFQRALTQAGSMELWRWVIRWTRAWLLVNRGMLVDAVAEVEDLLRAAVDQADAGREGRARELLAYVHHHLGNFAAAAREAELSLSQPTMMSIHRSMILATLAAARVAQGRADEALAAAREAMGDREPPPVRVYGEPFIRLAHVEALTAAGEQDAALAALVLARKRLLATASRIADPALRRSFLEDVTDNARTLRLAEERLGPASAKEP
jgi:eukaryotic-like serine/threonine-protein kinase